MENLLDYLLYALFGHNVTNVKPLEYVKAWSIVLEDKIFIVLDEHDIRIIRSIYDKRYEFLNSEQRERYEKIFNLCK